LIILIYCLMFSTSRTSSDKFSRSMFICTLCYALMLYMNIPFCKY
jgi:hypothetical protein